MRPLVIGTAGHIDHGKTALVKALTGVDTDRLVEERRRGITIELGFTHLTLPSGRAAGFVDVPGHERFVRMMIAGATGMDLVLLVIAADEGVMPQTREHLDILELLGVKAGIVVLTKIDLVDDELLELAQLDAEEFVMGTGLEGAPILAVSSATKAGIPELMAAMEAVAAEVKPRGGSGLARLAVDRVFSQRGFGTVVTGTLASGSISVGDSLELLPAGEKVKVRGVQVHEQDVEIAHGGGRTAINLQGVDRDAVSRGDVLAAPGSLVVSPMLDAWVKVLPSAAHPLGARVDDLTQEIIPRREAVRARYLSGTLEVLGRFQPLGVDCILPGDSGYVQVRLERPIPLAAGDRFVIRTESPMVTVAGGVVVHPSPHRHRRRDGQAAAQRLTQLWQGGATQRILGWLAEAGPQGMELGELSRLSRLSEDAVKQAVEGAKAEGDVLELGASRLVATGAVEAVEAAIIEGLGRHHASRPLSPGATRGELRPGAWISDRLMALALDRLTEGGAIKSEGPTYALSAFEMTPTEAQAALGVRLVGALAAAGLTPPTLPQLLVDLGDDAAADVASVEDLVVYLCGRGELVRVKEGLIFHAGALDGLRAKVSAFLEAEGEMSPTDFKDLAGLTRRHAIPLLEYLDRIQLTLRVGDRRRLRI